MSLALDPRHYAIVPVLFWPLLFLRLWALQGWIAQTGRSVLFRVTSRGQLLIEFIDDDPHSFAGWQARNLAARAHLGVLAAGANGGVFAVSPIMAAIGAALERFGCLERWIAVRHVARALPAIADSS